MENVYKIYIIAKWDDHSSAHCIHDYIALLVYIEDKYIRISR
jgi:hypothetical protein